MKDLKYIPEQQLIAVRFREYPQYDVQVKILQQVHDLDGYDYMVEDVRKKTVFYVFQHQLLEEKRK